MRRKATEVVDNANSRWHEEQAEMLVQRLRDTVQCVRECMVRPYPPSAQAQGRQQQQHTDDDTRHWQRKHVRYQIAQVLGGDKRQRGVQHVVPPSKFLATSLRSAAVTWFTSIG